MGALQLWLNSATAGLAMTRLIKAVRNYSSKATRLQLLQITSATALLSTVVYSVLVTPVLATFGASPQLSREIAGWVAMYLLAQAVRA